MADTRFVYGLTCTWIGAIQEVAFDAAGIPCCPKCKGALGEFENEVVWRAMSARWCTEHNVNADVYFAWRLWLKAPLQCTPLEGFDFKKSLVEFGENSRGWRIPKS